MNLSDYRITPADVEILKAIRDGLSYKEMTYNILGAIHVGPAVRRVARLENLGLVNPPPIARMARSRTLTLRGVQVLEMNGGRYEPIQFRFALERPYYVNRNPIPEELEAETQPESGGASIHPAG